jgi:hypothetical protein
MAAIQLKNILKKVYGVKSETESHYNEKKKDEGEQLAQEDPSNLMDDNSRKLLQEQLVELMMNSQK